MQSVAQRHMQTHIRIGEQRAARSTLCNRRAERQEARDTKGYEKALAAREPPGRSGRKEIGWAVGPCLYRAQRRTGQRKYGPTVESKEEVMYRKERKGESSTRTKL